MASLPQQGPFRHLMDMKAERRLAGWRERRNRFGDISTHKCYQFGQIFSPFQALATTVSFYHGEFQIKSGGGTSVKPQFFVLFRSVLVSSGPSDAE